MRPHFLALLPCFSLAAGLPSPFMRPAQVNWLAGGPISVEPIRGRVRIHTSGAPFRRSSAIGLACVHVEPATLTRLSEDNLTRRLCLNVHVAACRPPWLSSIFRLPIRLMV